MRLVFANPSLQRAARTLVVVALVASLAISVAACSSANQAQYQNPAWAGAQPPVPAPQKQATYEAAPGDPIKDEPIEPRRAPGVQADDPNEPFSPNYGGARNRPTVRVSDTTPEARDPEPDQKSASMWLPAPARAYFNKVTTTASAD